MSEMRRPSDEDYNADDSRRSFLKKIGVIGAKAAGVGAVGAGAYAAAESFVPKGSEKIKIESTPVIYNVEKGDNPWVIYKKSGWDDGSVEFSDFWNAVKKENTKANEVDMEHKADLNNLQPGDSIWTLMRNNKEGEK